MVFKIKHGLRLALLLTLFIFLLSIFHVINFNRSSHFNLPSQSDKLIARDNSRINSYYSSLELLNTTLLAFHQELKQIHQFQLNPNLRTPIDISKIDVSDKISQVNTIKSLEITNKGLGSNNKIKDIPKEPPAFTKFLKKKRAVIFTMDSISTYEENSLKGGASGEITIRKSLEFAFQHFSVDVSVIKSDAEFNKLNLSPFDIIILDPWTWAAAGKSTSYFLYCNFILIHALNLTLGWVPKRNIVGNEDKLFFLDFFGNKELRGGKFRVSPKRFLTAFPTTINSFLGYYMEPLINGLSLVKEDYGVIWGKDPKHYEGKRELLTKIANEVIIYSTSSTPIRDISHPNIKYIGHLSPDKWLNLLSKSKFLIGLGNPLLGPSAMDAVSLGNMFINPIYKSPILELHYENQHPYIVNALPSYVCSYHEDNTNEALGCIHKARSANLPPLIPKDYQKENYLLRVKQIFQL